MNGKKFKVPSECPHVVEGERMRSKLKPMGLVQQEDTGALRVTLMKFHRRKLHCNELKMTMARKKHFKKQVLYSNENAIGWLVARQVGRDKKGYLKKKNDNNSHFTVFGILSTIFTFLKCHKICYKYLTLK